MSEYRFDPPTRKERYRDPAGGFPYSMDVGVSVVKVDGTYTVFPAPTSEDIAGLTDGVDYFLGGRVYWVDAAVANDLTNDGFQVLSGLTPSGSLTPSDSLMPGNSVL